MEVFQAYIKYSCESEALWQRNDSEVKADISDRI